MRLIILLMAIAVLGCTEKVIKPKSLIRAEDYLRLEMYEVAVRNLEMVDPINPYRPMADSLLLIAKKEIRKQSVADSLQAVNDRIESNRKLVSDINKKLYKLESNKFPLFGNTLDGLSREMDFYYESLLIAKKTNTIDSLKAKGQALRKKVSQTQKKNFPKLRKSFGELTYALLWEDDIKVYTKGSKHQYVYFEGGIYATNKNKQHYFETLKPELSRLKFKRVYFKWYSGDSGMFYTLEPSPDEEVF